MTTVALAMVAPLGSWMVPEVLPARCCAGSRRAERGKSTNAARNGIRNFAFKDKRRRLTNGFTIAANLLSRFVGRAMARAVDQARPEFSSVLARSSSWVA